MGWDEMWLADYEYGERGYEAGNFAPLLLLCVNMMTHHVTSHAVASLSTFICGVGA